MCSTGHCRGRRMRKQGLNELLWNIGTGESFLLWAGACFLVNSDGGVPMKAPLLTSMPSKFIFMGSSLPFPSISMVRSPTAWQLDALSRRLQVFLVVGLSRIVAETHEFAIRTLAWNGHVSLINPLYTHQQNSSVNSTIDLQPGRKTYSRHSLWIWCAPLQVYLSSWQELPAAA